MKKTLLSLCLLAISSYAATAQTPCPDFSGRYLLQYLNQAGQVQFTIAQTACTQIRFSATTTTRGRTATEQHTLKTGGQFQDDTPWLGSTERLQTSVKFVSAALEIIARPAAPKTPSEFSWKRLFVLRSNGDLELREFNKQEDMYEPAGAAVRQQ